MFHGYLPQILKGALLTVEIAVLSAVIAVVIGIAVAVARLSRYKILSALAFAYTTFVRGVPDLVWMSLIFFGGQILVNSIGDSLGWDYIDVNPFIAGVLTIGFIFGAYMGETFRGALLAVSKGESEAGLAIGMSPVLIFRRITFPAMMRHALPGISNNWMVLVKTTALVSVIGLQDMVYIGTSAGRSTSEPFSFLLLVAALFLVLTAASNLLLKHLERKFSIVGR